MPNDIIVAQEVKKFPNKEKIAKQKITIDVKDNWVFINHDGDVLSMSLDNFFELQCLSGEAIKNYKSLK